MRCSSCPRRTHRRVCLGPKGPTGTTGTAAGCSASWHLEPPAACPVFLSGTPGSPVLLIRHELYPRSKGKWRLQKVHEAPHQTSGGQEKLQPARIDTYGGWSQCRQISGLKRKGQAGGPRKDLGQNQVGRAASTPHGRPGAEVTVHTPRGSPPPSICRDRQGWKLQGGQRSSRDHPSGTPASERGPRTRTGTEGRSPGGRSMRRPEELGAKPAGSEGCRQKGLPGNMKPMTQCHLGGSWAAHSVVPAQPSGAHGSHARQRACHRHQRQVRAGGTGDHSRPSAAARSVCWHSRSGRRFRAP